MLIERSAKTIGDVITAARDICNKFTPDIGSPADIWFRGQSEKQYSLVPKLYRSESIASNFDEESLFNLFKALALPVLPRAIETDWDWYYVARHHGLPSRLLDWTESLILGVYFALEAGHEIGPNPSGWRRSRPWLLIMETRSQSCGYWRQGLSIG